MAEPAATVLRPGRLLVATPRLVDPNFERGVVLLLDHDDSGSLGVVLNRPSPVPVRDILPGWEALVAEPGVLFHGGPVAIESALAVASISSHQDPAGDPVGFRRLFDQTGIVDLDTPTELLAGAVTGMRIFVGYAGWGDGQLAAEIEEGSWYVVPPERGDIYGASPGGLWTGVLRRQPGELAWVSTRPPDPTLN
jgi:putative transcriptional regulator